MPDQPCLAQGSASEQIWFDVTDYFRINQGFSIGGDAGIRGMVFSDEEWMALYIRPSVSYRASRDLEFSGGLGLFQAFRPGPEDALEVRPWGGVRYMWPRSPKMTLEHYFRAEGRNVRLGQNQDFRSALRLRYRIATYLPITSEKSTGRGIYLPLQYEWFMDAAGDVPARFINQNRFVAGFGYRLSSKWRFELQYTLVLFRESARDGFEPFAHVFRFRVLG